MPKQRVSIKGKGADIFFGDEDGAVEETPSEQPGPAPLPSIEPDTAPVTQAVSPSPESRLVSVQEPSSPNGAAQEPSKPANQQTSSPNGAEFDINESPVKKETYVFTLAEAFALEDLKRDLRRTFDLKASKQDLLRCALHLLVEDYQKRAGDSHVVKRFKKKSPA